MSEDPTVCHLCGTKTDPNMQWRLVLKDVFNDEIGVSLNLCEVCYKAEVACFSQMKRIHS